MAEIFNIIPSSVVGQLFREYVKGGLLKVFFPGHRWLTGSVFMAESSAYAPGEGF